jgi:hypothetical protein
MKLELKTGEVVELIRRNKDGTFAVTDAQGFPKLVVPDELKTPLFELLKALLTLAFKKLFGLK